MTSQKIIGHIDCPICGHHDAEVKTDKNGRAYIHCKHSCSWQGITRTDHQSGHLKGRMRALLAPENKPEQTEKIPVSVTVTEPPAPAPKPEPKPAQKAVTKQTPEAPRKQASGGWFQPLIGKGA